MIISDIIEASARMFNLTTDDIYGPFRSNYICRARFALYKGLNLRGASQLQIGRWMKRDHSSIKHGVKRANYMLERDPEFRQCVEKIAKMGKEDQ